MVQVKAVDSQPRGQIVVPYSMYNVSKLGSENIFKRGGQFG
jgi:hypothetical protein